VHSLPLFVRLQGRRVLLLGQGEAAEAKRRLLDRAGALVVSEGTAALAIVAIEDDADAEAAVARLKAAGTLVNAVDRPALCDFTLPAIVDRDPVLVAIGTGGASAGLAKALRQRLETLLPASLGKLANELADARGIMRERWPDPRDRRHALDAGFAAGGLLDPLAAAPDVARWLTDGAAPESRTVRIVLASPDPDDLTLRQARWLGEADRIVTVGDVPEAILARARADAERGGDGGGLTVVIEAA
jgi:uroporphyrin-III C-methyltransferase / precorrin-2 dehydrogenase / sirohydrochlorin ferrochelatase